MSAKINLSLLITSCLFVQPLTGVSLTEDVQTLSYEHDKFSTQPREHFRKFEAFVLSFDSRKDGVTLGTPKWVSYELRRSVGSPSGGNRRPRKWSTDPELFHDRIAPNDDSYRNSGFSRGHLCMKSHAARISKEADRESHTVLNACPQVPGMNGGIWSTIEHETSKWADKYGCIWITTGPIFFEDEPKNWIGDDGEVPVAVPDAFFKIAARLDGDNLKVLSFVVPMYGGHKHHNFGSDVTPFLTSVDVIERLTGLDFFSTVPEDKQEVIERVIETETW